MNRASPTRTYAATAPPRYPVRSAAPRTLVRGISYDTVLATSINPSGTISPTLHPIFSAFATASAGGKNFVVAFIGKSPTRGKFDHRPTIRPFFDATLVRSVNAR